MVIGRSAREAGNQQPCGGFPGGASGERHGRPLGERKSIATDDRETHLFLYQDFFHFRHLMIPGDEKGVRRGAFQQCAERVACRGDCVFALALRARRVFPPVL